MKNFFFIFIFLIIFTGIALAVPLSETEGTLSAGDLSGDVPADVSAPTTPPETPGGGSTGGGGGGGGGGVAVVTTTDLEEKLDFESASGFTTEAAQGSAFSFKDSAGEKHTINITKVYVDRVLLTITSSPITITVKIGETKELDVNNDAIKDIAIKLVDIVYGKAKLTFKKLAEKVEAPAEEIPTEEVPVVTPPTEEVEPEVEEEAKPIPYQTIIIILVIVALAVIIYIIMKKKKASSGF